MNEDATAQPYSKEVLRSLRRIQDMTQGEMANALDVTQATVSEWERGKSKPSRRRLTRLAHLLDQPQWLDVGVARSAPSGAWVPGTVPFSPYPAFGDWIIASTKVLDDDPEVDMRMLSEMASQPFPYGKVPTVQTYWLLLPLYKTLRLENEG